MEFSKETYTFIIKNAAMLDGGAVEAVQKAVFTAINARIANRFKALGGWKGTYGLVSEEDGETRFAPAAWPEDKNGKYRAYYEMTEVSSETNIYWLSSALGVNGVKMCFRFWVHGGLGGHGKGEIERKLVTLSNDPRSILKYADAVIACDIHTRERTKKKLKPDAVLLIAIAVAVVAVIVLAFGLSSGNIPFLNE